MCIYVLQGKLGSVRFITSLSRTLFQKILLVFQLVNEFLEYNPQPDVLFKICFYVILPFASEFPVWFYPFRFSDQHFLCIYYPSHALSNLNFLKFVTIYGEESKLWSSSLWSFLRHSSQSLSQIRTGNNEQEVCWNFRFLSASISTMFNAQYGYHRLRREVGEPVVIVIW